MAGKRKIGAAHGELELDDALAVHRLTRNHGNTQLVLEPGDTNVESARDRHIHHVQNQDHRSAEIQNLVNEVEVSFEIRGVDNAQDSVGLRRVSAASEEHVTRHDIIACGRRALLCDRLREYCNAAVRVRTVDARGNWYTVDRDGTRSVSLATGNWEWDAMDPLRFTRFWVIIYPTAAGEPWEATTPNVGDAGLWGDAIGRFDSLGNAKEPTTIGQTATPEHVAKIRTIIRDWQPDGTRCEWVIVALDDASFDPTAPEPDGTWAAFGKNDAGAYTASRLSTARYWRGRAGAEYP